MSKERLLLRVSKGCLTPADEHTQAVMRERGYHIGDVLSAELRKPRNPEFHRLAHVFGQMLADNLDDFNGLSAHTVLKRIQLEAGIACDELWLNMPSIGPVAYRIPKSISFAQMDEAEFLETYRQMCEYISRRYWKDLDAQQIQDMAQVMVSAA